MLIAYQGKSPQIAPNVFVAPTATLIGDVVVESGASIWFGAVLRADLNQIVVGANTSIQDNCVVHCNSRYATRIGADCVVGHGVVMEGCHIAPSCLIGMNATILSGTTIGSESIIAAGAVIREGTDYDERVLLAGVPAQVRRATTDDDLARIQRGVAHYLKESQIYRGMFPDDPAYSFS